MPAVASMLPGVELDAFLSLVPVLNVSLVSKEILSGTLHWGHLALIFLSSSVYAGAALAFAIWQFNRESVLFRS
jgi:sodium transport system permease protein